MAIVWLQRFRPPSLFFCKSGRGGKRDPPPQFPPLFFHKADTNQLSKLGALSELCISMDLGLNVSTQLRNRITIGTSRHSRAPWESLKPLAENNLVECHDSKQNLHKQGAVYHVGLPGEVTTELPLLHQWRGCPTRSGLV